jgi:septal ring factor EnvC (AmiA/AmiB activator)
MEYIRNICITQQDFHEILASGYDCDMYLKMSSLIGAVFGTTLLLMTHHLLNQKLEIDNLTQVKRSLMEHISNLEDELTQLYTQEEEEKEEEEEEEEEKEEKEEEQEDAQDKALSEDLHPTSDLSDKEPHED